MIDCHAIENYKLQTLAHSKKNITHFIIVTLEFSIKSFTHKAKTLCLSETLVVTLNLVGKFCTSP
jgi:hypothetical protein